jgi:hypothetical protein
VEETLADRRPKDFWIRCFLFFLGNEQHNNELHVSLCEYPGAVGKTLHSKTWLDHCMLTGGAFPSSVGRELKMEIPDNSSGLRGAWLPRRSITA